MGVVYAALDPELGRKVAIKLMRRGSDTAGRLLAEAQALARLSHPNIVAVHDVGTIGGRVFVAMELVDGETLAAWLATRPRRAQVLAALADAGRGLAAAHAAGLVHGDFKPDNVVVGRDGRVRVVDFGLARLLAGEPSAAPVRAGTPAYMAPEQCEGRPVDARGDQFAFCVTAWECLFGEHPFLRATAVETMDAIVHGRRRPPPREGGARALARTLARGLQVRPEDRFPSMDALLEELLRDPWRPLKRAALALFGAAAVAGIADTVYLLTRPGEVAVLVTADGRPLVPARVTVGAHALAPSPTGAEGHVPAGTHVLRVAAPDHLPEETIVEVERGGRVQVALELRRATGTFELEVEPPGSAVLVDGVDYGSRLRRVAVPTGPHDLLVRRAGYHDVRLRWAAERDAVREGFVALPPAQAWSAMLTGHKEPLRVLGDADGDGRPELLVVNFGTLSAVDPWRDRALWRLVAGSRRGIVHRLADVDGDGVGDLVVATAEPGQEPTLAVYAGSARGLSRGEEPAPRRLWQQRERGAAGFLVVALDRDGDGAAELIVDAAGRQLHGRASVSGRPRWRATLAEPAVDLGLHDGGEAGLLIHTAHERLAVDPDSGSVRWRRPLGGDAGAVHDVLASAELDGAAPRDWLVLAHAADRSHGSIAALRGSDGAPLWRRELAQAEWTGVRFAAAAGRLLVPLRLRALLLDAPTGHVLADISSQAAPVLLALAGEHRVVGWGDGSIAVHDARDGAGRARFPADRWTVAPPIAHDWDGDGAAEIVVADPEGTIAAHAPDGRLVGSLYLPDHAAERLDSVGDLDGDGFDELAVHSVGGLALLGGPKIRWWRRTQDAIRTTPIVADLDGDGALEVAVGATMRKFRGVHVFAAGDGDHRSRTDLHWTGADLIRSPGLVAREAGGFALLPAHSDPLRPRALALDARGEPLALGAGTPGYATPAVVELAGEPLAVYVPWSAENPIVGLDARSLDLRWELPAPAGAWAPPVAVEAAGRTLLVFGFHDGSLRALDMSSRTWLWSRVLGDMFYVEPAAGDLDGDGALELAAAVAVGEGGDLAVVRAEDGELAWRRAGEAGRVTRPALADVDGDGRLDLFSAGADGICRWSYDGALRWRFRPGPPAGPVPGSGGGVLLSDLDGDGAAEVLVGMRDGALYVLDAATGALRWQFRTDGAYIEAAPVAADVDGDGVQEVFVAGHDQTLYALRAPARRR